MADFYFQTAYDTAISQRPPFQRPREYGEGLCGLLSEVSSRMGGYEQDQPRDLPVCQPHYRGP